MAEDEPEDSEPVRITRAQIEQIREMHAAFLSDPANAGKPRPVIQVSDRDEKDFSETTYLFIDYAGELRTKTIRTEFPPQPAAIDGIHSRKALKWAAKFMFENLCKRYGQAEARRLWLEAAGLAEAEDENCTLLEQFIYRKVSPRRLAHALGSTDKKRAAIEQQLRSLIGKKPRKMAPPYLRALIEEAGRVYRNVPRKPGRPKK